MSWKDRIPAEKLKRVLPFAFLLYGLFSVFTLQRDFSHTTRLSIFLILIGPSFISFALLTRLLEKVEDGHRLARYRNFLRLANLSATQMLTQYILIFCLPFYILKENWIYFAIHSIWLATALWDPFYERLIQSAVYRHSLLAWSLMSATSFLFPFVLPGHISWFYPVLAGVSSFAFIPLRKEKTHLLSLAILLILFLFPTLFLSASYRFPILSVWAQKPHFAWDASHQKTPPEPIGDEIHASDLSSQINEGHSLCCVAPIVSPPNLALHVKQEWTLGGRVIESTELKTKIKGNAAQEAFHSYFCKRNFPLADHEETLKCRIKIGDSIDIGGTRVEIN